MALLGPAAMLLSFDVVDEAIAEHDDWHTHEHLPERLSIPGFLRGTRWVATASRPRYLVLYEVAALASLTSDAYLERLNHPSPWTTKMMQHYRGMQRGLCAVTGSRGLGIGHAAALLRFKPAPAAITTMRRWLLEDVVAQLPGRPGIGSAHLLEAAAATSMTSEQRIRGADASIDCALLVTAYAPQALTALAQGVLGVDELASQGAQDVVEARYRFDYTLTREELVP